MNVFYNREGIGDVLLVSLKPIPAEERAFVKRGDVVRIFRSGAERRSVTTFFPLLHTIRFPETARSMSMKNSLASSMTFWRKTVLTNRSRLICRRSLSSDM